METGRKNRLSPSILAADFNRLGADIREAEEAGADFIHVDVMDGDFVPSISFGMPVIRSIRRESGMFFDVHLMVREPIRYLAEIADCGADLITVHLEACADVKKTLFAIRELGCQAGLSIKPGTPVSALEEYLPDVDLVLIMSVEPGFGGQKLLPESYERLREARRRIVHSGRGILLEVDGGITLENVSEILAAGADVIVAGSAIFRGNIRENVTAFRNLLQK